MLFLPTGRGHFNVCFDIKCCCHVMPGRPNTLLLLPVAAAHIQSKWYCITGIRCSGSTDWRGFTSQQHRWRINQNSWLEKQKVKMQVGAWALVAIFCGCICLELCLPLCFWYKEVLKITMWSIFGNCADAQKVDFYVYFCSLGCDRWSLVV